MSKKILLGLLFIVALVGGIAAFSAFEAHVINVTAHIENALSVPVDHIAFGTVFPQEHLEFPLDISLSDSFLEQGRVDEVSYVIKQKPKPIPVTPPTIDGVKGTGEWDEAEIITVGNGKGIVSLMADTNYIYALFEILDSTDARLGENSVGNDQTGLNINPTDGGSWGKPYDIVFQTGADACAFTTPVPDNPCQSSGDSDGWETEWVIDGTQYPIPGNLDTKTIYSGGTRVAEWKVPLASIGLHAGDEIKIGGSANVDGSYNPYPIGLDWNDVDTFYVLQIPAYPDLCPYVSKTPDNDPKNDTGVPAFHQPDEVANGLLTEPGDISDNWIIDLEVPCFEGMCAQDWTHYGWELDPALESSSFGCDLWIEVTEISELE